MSNTRATDDESAPPEGPRLIKRYANRKLYDTQESRYVTLQQIADFVRAGDDIRIVDNTTKEDLTHVTLAQIIVEEEKKGEGDAPRASVGALRSFIEHGRERLMSSLREGPVGRLGSVGKLVRSKEDGLRDDAGEGGPEARRSARSLPRELLDELSRVADERVRMLLSGALGHVQQLHGEVSRLQHRIEELEERLRKLTKKPGDEDGDDPSDPA